MVFAYKRIRKASRLNARRVMRRLKKGVWAKKKVQYIRGNKGKITIVRKLPEIVMSNNGVSGVTNLAQTLTAGAPVCVTLGTPTQSVGATGSNTYDIPFSLQFALSQVINHTDITNLCDKYRIAGAYVRVYYNKTGSSGASTSSFPHLQFITDHDDSNVPSLAQLREKMGVKMKTFQNSSSYIGMKVRPVPNRQIYSSALVNGYEVPKYAPYLDCTTDGVPHYGIKGVISNFPLATGTANIELLKFDVALVIKGKDIQ